MYAHITTICSERFASHTFDAHISFLTFCILALSFVYPGPIALLSLQALLCCPNADDPQDAQVARQYKSNRKEFEATAKFWTETYAGPKKGPSDKQLAMIKSVSEQMYLVLQIIVEGSLQTTPVLIFHEA